ERKTSSVSTSSASATAPAVAGKVAAADAGAGADDRPCTFRRPAAAFDFHPLPQCDGTIATCTDACEKKMNSAACVDVGERYRTGNSVQQDLPKALSF